MLLMESTEYKSTKREIRGACTPQACANIIKKTIAMLNVRFVPLPLDRA